MRRGRACARTTTMYAVFVCVRCSRSEQCKGIRPTRTVSSVQQQLNRRRLFSSEQIVDVYGLFRIFFVFSHFFQLSSSALKWYFASDSNSCRRKSAESAAEINLAFAFGIDRLFLSTFVLSVNRCGRIEWTLSETQHYRDTYRT